MVISPEFCLGQYHVWRRWLSERCVQIYELIGLGSWVGCPRRESRHESTKEAFWLFSTTVIVPNNLKENLIYIDESFLDKSWNAIFSKVLLNIFWRKETWNNNSVRLDHETGDKRTIRPWFYKSLKMNSENFSVSKTVWMIFNEISVIGDYYLRKLRLFLDMYQYRSDLVGPFRSEVRPGCEILDRMINNLSAFYRLKCVKEVLRWMKI